MDMYSFLYHRVMPISSEEMRLRDIAIGLQAELTESNYQRQAELTESNYQRQKVELTNAELRSEIQDLSDRIRLGEVAQEALQKASQQATEKLLRVIAERDVEITAIRQSHTWKIGSLVLAPVRWIKRSKR